MVHCLPLSRSKPKEISKNLTEHYLEELLLLSFSARNFQTFLCMCYSNIAFWLPRQEMASACSVTNIRTILRTLDKGACIVLTHLDSSPARLPCTLKAARNFFKVDLNCFITRNFEIEENNKLKGQLFLFLETLPKWSAERKENILIAWGHFVLQTS